MASSSSYGAGLTRRLAVCAAALGSLTGLMEVCWAYQLPWLFPGRRYVLPIATFPRFVLIALLTDIVLAFVAAALLGLILVAVVKLFPRTRSFRYGTGFLSTLMLAGAVTALFVIYVYSYNFVPPGPPQHRLAALGVAVLIVVSVAIGWLIEVARQRIHRVAPVAAWIIAVAALLSAIVPGFISYRRANTFPKSFPVLTADRRPNILLVTLDTCRSDFLACYGSPVVKTPTLDSLAGDGCLFEYAFAQAPSTVPSHGSLMTSTYASRHGGVNGAAIRGDLPTLAEILRANGYDTAAFVSAAVVQSGMSGLDRGFDYYEDSISPWTAMLRNDEFQFLVVRSLLVWLQHHEIRGNVVSDRAVSWLEQRDQIPFLCWLHYFDPHAPYDPPEDYRVQHADMFPEGLPRREDRILYAGEVQYADAQLGRVITSLRIKGLYDNTLILVTADHGEAFGETHGDITERGHGNHLYDTTQHVPLIIKLPQGGVIAHRFREIVQLIDLAPTILDYLGASAPASYEGRSLRGLLEGQAGGPWETAYAERTLGHWIKQSATTHTLNRLMSVRTRESKYIGDESLQRQELYDVSGDPAETRNVVRLNRPLARSLHQSMIRVLGENTVTPTATDLDPSAMEKLRALGYLGDDADE